MHKRTKNTCLPVSITACALGFTLGFVQMSAIANAADTALPLVAQDASELQIVIKGKTPMRCGDQDVYYAIAELDALTKLQAVGHSGSFTRVLIPSNIGVFVPVNEVEISKDARWAKLLVDSKLRAPSHLLGIAGSWKAIYDQPLPAGTNLEVIEVLSDDSGAAVGYRVIAPKSPSGQLPVAYVRTESLRDPTAKELGAQTIAPSADTPVDSVSQAQPEPVADPAADTSLLQDMDLPVQDQGTKPSESEPVEIQNSTPVDSSPDQPVESSASTNTRTATDGQIPASTLQELEAAFDQARTLPKAQLDETLNELFAEFSRAHDQATPGSSTAHALEQRLEWLDIRMKSRDQRLAITLILAAYDAQADQLAKDIEAWQSGRAYQLVGRMVTSAIYTGEHLPLLYRIQATDPATGMAHTVGYVAPRADQDFRHLLGRVVGVVGAMTDDSSLHLKVIEPDRIDPMPE